MPWNDSNNYLGEPGLAPLAVDEATQLEGGQNVIEATIPLASANSYAITLPPVASCPWQRFLVWAKRATGSYVDGGVTLQDADDNSVANFASDAMTATNDYVYVENVGGRFWRLVAEVTT